MAIRKHAFYNPYVPISILAITHRHDTRLSNPYRPTHMEDALPAQGLGDNTSQSLKNTGTSTSTLFRCEHGIGLSTTDAIILDMPHQVSTGTRLLSLNYAYTGISPEEETGSALPGLPSNASFYPLLLSSRALNSTGKVVLTNHADDLGSGLSYSIAEASPHFQTIIEDSHTIAYFPMHRDFAIQVTPKAVGLIYLCEDPGKLYRPRYPIHSVYLIAITNAMTNMLTHPSLPALLNHILLTFHLLLLPSLSHYTLT